MSALKGSQNTVDAQQVVEVFPPRNIHINPATASVSSESAPCAMTTDQALIARLLPQLVTALKTSQEPIVTNVTAAVPEVDSTKVINDAIALLVNGNDACHLSKDGMA